MEIFHKLNKIENVSLCLGFFDGVHQGHKVVLKNAVNLAEQCGIKSAVLTFKEHPLCYLQNKDPQYILSLEDRLELIGQQGIDYIYVLDFDEVIADCIAYDYVKNILVENFKPKFITTGFNHYFGANKLGDASFLRSYEEKYGYKYFEIPPISYNNTLISSTKIRQYVKSGSVEEIRNLLGQDFYVKGVVKKGNQIGRTISFPTINLDYPKDIIKIDVGAYASIVEIDGKKYKAIANFGNRPTINKTGEKSLLLEAHLLEFDGNLYSKEAKISFLKKLRDEKKFESLESLKERLLQDKADALLYFDSKAIL